MNNHPSPSDNHSQLSSLGSRLFAVKAVRVWTVIALFFIGLFLASVGIMLTGSSTRGQLLASALVQDLFAFALPAFLGGWLFTGRPWQWAGLSRPAPALSLMGVVSVCFVSHTPWASTHRRPQRAPSELPDFLSGLEVTIRRLEDQAAATTSLLLGEPSVWGLVSGITIIGVIGPFCEELFFRGALQKSLYGRIPGKLVGSRHLLLRALSDVRLSATSFSAYGSVVYTLWTGRLWPSVLAHALNNTATVVTQWLVLRGVADPSLFDIGSGGHPVVIIITAAITTLAVWGMWRLYGRKRHG